MSTHDPKKLRSQHALQLARAHYAYTAILVGLSHLEAMEKLCRQEQGLLWQAHWTAFVVSYSRPFVKSDHLGLEKKRIVPGPYRTLHLEVVERYRNATVAHTDPNEKDLNSAIFRINDGLLVPEPDLYHPKPDMVQECATMANAVLEEVAKALGERLELFPELTSLANGSYNFDMTADPGSEWQSA